MLSKFTLAVAIFAIAGIDAIKTESSMYRGAPTRPTNPRDRILAEKKAREEAKAEREAAAEAAGPKPLIPETPPGAPANDGIDRTGWFSYYEQYSPPKTKYRASKLHNPVYAICSFEDAFDDHTESGTIQLQQESGYSIMVRFALSGLDSFAKYRVRIN